MEGLLKSVTQVLNVCWSPFRWPCWGYYPLWSRSICQPAGPGWLRTSSAILLSKAAWSPVHRLGVPALLIFRLSDVKPNQHFPAEVSRSSSGPLCDLSLLGPSGLCCQCCLFPSDSDSPSTKADALRAHLEEQKVIRSLPSRSQEGNG